jgi:DNA mismatch repair ATPase MutS
MLSGTNSRERNVASLSVARQLLSHRRSFGLVTTHDLSLVALESRFPERVTTCHFTDRFDGEALHFDYRLRPGVATTTNALDVLRLEGIEVDPDATESP